MGQLWVEGGVLSVQVVSGDRSEGTQPPHCCCLSASEIRGLGCHLKAALPSLAFFPLFN